MPAILTGKMQFISIFKLLDCFKKHADVFPPVYDMKKDKTDIKKVLKTIALIILYTVASLFTLLAAFVLIVLIAFILLQVLIVTVIALAAVFGGIVLIGIAISKFFIIPRGSVCVAGLGLCMMGAGIGGLTVIVGIAWSVYMAFNRNAFRIRRKKEMEKEKAFNEVVA